MDYDFDPFQEGANSARIANVAALDSDPEQAARAVELSDASGVPATAIYGDVDGFERQHRAALGSDIIANNLHIADYLNSHPMAPRISHDDLGNLDNASQAIGAIKTKSFAQEAVDWLKSDTIARGAQHGFGDQPLGSMFVGEGFKPTGNPVLDSWYKFSEATARATTSIPELALRSINGAIFGAAYGIAGEERGERLGQVLMDPGLQATLHGLGPPGALAEGALAMLRTASPWLRAGKDAPAGIHPEIDKIKIEQAKTDGDALADALAASVKSATRERAPDFYANFARQHVGDQEIGIGAEAVRKLYGDKDPAPGDGLLGDLAPDLADRLRTAEATGGDVQVPLADWLAKVDPDTAKDLHDNLRLRPDGLTIEEGKALEPKDSIAEALPSLRAHAGLEPMFSVGDRKVKLERMKAVGLDGDEQAKAYAQSQGVPNWDTLSEIQRNGYRDDARDINFQGRNVQFHDFHLLDDTGKPVGSLNLSEQQGGKQLYIEMIQAGADKRMYDPNFLGPALIRDLFRQLKAEFPNAESITGHRVSGAREKSGAYDDFSKSMPVIKFDQLNDPTLDLRKIFEGGQSFDMSHGIEAYYSPLLRENQVAADAAIREELARIVPKQASVFTPNEITIPDKPGFTRRGMYTQFTDQNPWISVALDGPDTIGVARHEAIHHLRQQGFFTDKEWATLEQTAKAQRWKDRFQIDDRYANLDEGSKLEEAIADGYREWKSGRSVPPEAHTIFEKLKAFFGDLLKHLGEVMGKEVTWEDLFQKVDKGEVGSREGNAPARDQAFRASDEPTRLPDLGGPEAEKLRDRIAKMSGELAVARDTGKDIKGPEFETQQAALNDARAQLRSITSQVVGMTVAQHERYMRLIRDQQNSDLEAASKRALEYQRKTQTKEWKAQRTEMRDQVREQLEGRPDIAVDQLMSSEKVKFHPDSLTREQQAALPKEFIQKKDGIAPDDIAGYFGYHSGDALVERLSAITADRKASGLKAREWLNKLIDDETDRRMQQEHGDLDQRILEDAKEQAISESQLNILHEEMLYLGSQAGIDFPFSKTALRGELKKLFDASPIGSLSTDKFLREAGKAGRGAEKGLLEQDFAEAYRYKQQQNHAMIMASYAKAYERARKSFDRSAKQFSKREIPSISQEWTNWIHDILQRTGNRVNRSVQDLQENIARQSEKTLTDFAEAKEAETFGLRETPIADFLLDPAFRSDMKKLTADQFFGLKQSIDVLAKQGRDEKKIILSGEAADRDVILREMREKLGTFPERTLPDERGAISRSLDLPRMFMAGLTNIETLLNRWDRADPRGIFNRTISYPLAKASNYKSALEREYAKAYGALGEIKDADKFVDAPFADPLSRTEANPEGRAWPGFTRKHVLAMLQNAGNKSNWRVLAKGYSADPEALMSWLHDHTTKEDWDRAQKMGDSVFHSLVAKADTVYENLTGATVEKIPLEPVETPYGTYPGWYHPLIADPIRKEVWVKDEDTGQWQRNATGKRGSVMDDSDYFHASTANGYTKRRTGAVYPLDLNFDMVPSRIKQMIHDIAFRDTIVQTEKIFGNKAFQAEVTKHYGPTYTELLMPYLKAMAGAESIPSKAGAAAARVSEYMRQNVISTYIGLNPYTALKHGPTAWVMSMREVGGKEFLGAVRSLYGQSPELGVSNSAFAMKYSEELQRRERHWQDTIAGEHKEIEGASTLREKVIEKGSWLVAQSDMLSAKPTWVASYNKYIGDGLSHGESVDLADRSVRRAHGSTAATNQPSLVRGGGPLHGWLTSVYGFFGTAMQRRIEIAHDLNDTYQLGKEGEIKAAAGNIPKIAADILTYVIWPTVVEEWVTGLNQDDRRGWGQRAISAGTMGLASSVLYLRDLVHGFATGQEPGVGLLSSVLHDQANIVRDLRKGKAAFNREHAGKTVGDALTVFGEATGMAPKVIGNAAKFGIDLVNRQQQAKTFGDYLRGVTHGRAKKREEK